MQSSHLISKLKGVNLCDEVTSQEVNVFIRIAVEVAVVISTGRLASLDKNTISWDILLLINYLDSMKLIVNESMNMIKWLSYIWRDIRCVESSIEIFLALSHSQTELANICWPIGVLSIWKFNFTLKLKFTIPIFNLRLPSSISNLNYNFNFKFQH